MRKSISKAFLLSSHFFCHTSQERQRLVVALHMQTLVAKTEARRTPEINTPYKNEAPSIFGSRSRWRCPLPRPNTLSQDCAGASKRTCWRNTSAAHECILVDLRRRGAKTCRRQQKDALEDGRHGNKSNTQLALQGTLEDAATSGSQVGSHEKQIMVVTVGKRTQISSVARNTDMKCRS